MATVDVISALRPRMTTLALAAGETIFRQGDPSDSFLHVDSGEVRFEIRPVEIDSESVLAYAGPGSLIGEIGILAGTPRSASAIAHTDVVLSRLPAEEMRRLSDEDPRLGLALLESLGRDAALRLLEVTERLAPHLDPVAADPEVERMVASALDAQREFAGWPEERVDALLKEIAETIVEHAEELAEATVQETTIGNVPDKVMKISFASLGVYASFAGAPGAGPLATDDERRVTEIASPVGVVFALVPITNPVSTFVNNALIALKGRNAIILSCHRGAQGTTNRTGELVEAVLARHEAPPGIVQWVRGRTSRQTTQRFLSHPGVSLVLATGGQSVVRAAYGSGKPAIGVGAGNAPAWIAPDADLAAAAQCVIESKGFDNGLVCGSEQHLVVDRSVHDAFVAALEAAGAAVLDAGRSAQLVARTFDPATGDLLLPFIGRTAELIATAAELDLPSPPRLLVFRADASHPEGAAARERLAPLLSLFTVEGEEAAIALCQTLLAYEGAGHTAVVHTEDDARADRFAAAMPVSRVLVNTPAAQGCCGVVTGLLPSLTLGCGTFGGNSTTDNVGYRNLLNVKRKALPHYGNTLAFRRLERKLRRALDRAAAS
jgi:acetaldehyde dehydrogenase/alcohol dehydrogenase